MRMPRRFFAASSGAAAVEMAIATPVLLILMFGSAEVGNYFVNEHSLVKAVRDGARFAGRQSMSNYTACSGTPGGTVVADTRNVVINGYYAASDGITPNIKAADITVTYDCVSQANSVDMKGIYKTRASICGGGALGCAQRVTVSATVNYKPILSSFGFSGLSIQLNASEQAAVMGI